MDAGGLLGLPETETELDVCIKHLIIYVNILLETLKFYNTLNVTQSIVTFRI